MDSQRINELLQPFFTDDASSGLLSEQRSRTEPAALRREQLQQLSSYLDLLLRWNSRVNLTAVRQPEEIVTRHFGESLFAARRLFASGAQTNTAQRVIDFGSGAGFPGLPIKIWVPEIELILIESNQKKTTFLREVIRTLKLRSTAVFGGRAEDFDSRAATVTLRAVERFEESVRVAERLAVSGGRLALLIGESQIKSAREVVAGFKWMDPIRIPESLNRVLLVGTAEP